MAVRIGQNNQAHCNTSDNGNVSFESHGTGKGEESSSLESDYAQVVAYPDLKSAEFGGRKVKNPP